jgi:predicted ABC-type exoprotein transport system permease subunit
MFGEFTEMITYHSILIKAMLGVLFIGMIIPFLTTECSKTVKRMRIYMFVSHGLITMIAFTGLIALIFAKMDFNLEIIVMIVAFLVMIMVEVLKYKKILKAKNSEGCSKKGRVSTLLFTSINIAIIAWLVVYKIMEAKSAIPTT